MTAGKQDETYQDPFVQEALNEPQEGAPRRRRTLSGKLVPRTLARIDPWLARFMKGAPHVPSTPESREAARIAKGKGRAINFGISPDAGLPRIACMKRGCKLPWEDHLTGAGRLRAYFAKDGGHESAADRVKSQSRASRRQAVISWRKYPRRKGGAASLYTHTIFVKPDGTKVRVPNDRLDALALAQSQRRG